MVSDSNGYGVRCGVLASSCNVIGMNPIAFNHEDFRLLIEVLKDAVDFQQVEVDFNHAMLPHRPLEDIEGVGELYNLTDLLTRLEKLYALMEGNNDENTGNLYSKL